MMPFLLAAAMIAIALTGGMAQEKPLPAVPVLFTGGLGIPELPGTLIPAPVPPRTLTKKEALSEIFTAQVQKQFWIDNFKALKNAADQGQLVEILDDKAGTYVKLRKVGKSRIAEKERNPKRRPFYWTLRKPAAGLLYQIASHMREQDLRAEPIEVTSLVRSWEYQKLLMKSNPTADVKTQGVPPTHVLGLAFDIAWAKMPAERYLRLKDLLDRLAGEGKIIYFREHKTQAAFHVIALPSAHEQFASYYDSFAAGLSTNASGGLNAASTR
jgi:hypothetical protein